MEANLTDIALNAASIVNGLNFATNCTTAMDWYEVNNPSQYWKVLNLTASNTCHSQPTYAYEPYKNNTLNLEFLRTALPSQYINDSAVLDILQAEMSTLWINGANISEAVDTYGYTLYNWTFVNITWYDHALWQIYSNCVGPEMFPIHLSDLNPTSNCSAAVPFLLTLNGTAINHLDSSVIAYHFPQYSKEEVQFWKSFLHPFNAELNLCNLGSGVIPVDYFNFIDGAIVRWYDNMFIQSDSTNVTRFARSVFDACRLDVCRAAGFSGNPDLDGIGVYATYLFETGLVSILWAYFQLSCMLNWGKARGRLLSAFHQASGNLLDGAMYFLLSLSLANLILLVSPDLTQYSLYASEIVVAIAFFNLVELLLVTSREVVRKRAKTVVLCSSLSFMFLFIPGLYILSTSGQMALNTSGQTGMIDQVCLDNQLNALPNSPPSKFYKKMSVATYSILGAFSLIVVILDWMGILDFEAHTLTTREKMCLTFISFIPVAMAWFHVVLLQNLREAMFIMTGGDWSSSTWGYGQVVALLTWIPAVMAFCLCLGEKKKDKKDYTRLHVDAKTLDAQLVCPESTSKEDNSAIITDDKEAQKTPGRTVEPLHYWNKEQHRVLAINF